MKRRDFLRSAGAAAVVPVLPFSAMVTPAAAAVPINSMQVGWAALYARVNNQATPALIQKWLRVGPEQANALMGELVNRNIIRMPAAGSAVAVQPMYPGGGYPGMFNTSKRVARTGNLEPFEQKASVDDKFRAMIAHVTEHPSYGWAA